MLHNWVKVDEYRHHSVGSASFTVHVYRCKSCQKRVELTSRDLLIRLKYYIKSPWFRKQLDHNKPKFFSFVVNSFYRHEGRHCDETLITNIINS